MNDSVIGRTDREQRRFSLMLCRAACDADFRALCLKDASRAYEALFGEEPPTAFQVRFCEPDAPPPGEGRLCLLPPYLRPTWLG